MIKYFKILAMCLALLLTAAALCACNGNNPEPADAANETQPAEAEATPKADDPAVTDEPVVTDEPAETDEPANTDEPAATDEPSDLPYHEVIPLDAAYSIDLDGDGADESVLITSAASTDYELDYNVSVTPGAGGKEPFTDSIGSGYECYAIAVDRGAGDGSKALLICHWYESDDYNTCILQSDGSGGFEINWVFGYFEDPTDSAEGCFEEGELCIYTRTEIMGTQFVYTPVRFTDEGYESVEGVYYYPRYEGSFISVIADLPVTIIDEETGESYGTVLSPGAAVTPMSTDMATYVVVRLSSGEDAYIFFDDFDYIPYINGRPQEDYLKVNYAD